MADEKIVVVCERISVLECPYICPLSHDAYTNNEPCKVCDKFNVNKGDVVTIEIKRNKDLTE